MATNHLFLAWVSALRETAEAPRKEKRRDSITESAGDPLYKINLFGLLLLPSPHPFMQLFSPCVRARTLQPRASSWRRRGRAREAEGRFRGGGGEASDLPTKKRKDEEVWEAGGREGGRGGCAVLTFHGVQRGLGGEWAEGRRGRGGKAVVFRKDTRSRRRK